MLRKTKEIILALCYKNKGDWSKIYADIQKKDFECDLEMPNCKENYITLLDNEYPQRIKEGYKPPFVLFYEGNVDLLNDYRKKVAIISSKETSASKIDYVLDKDNADYIYVLNCETETDLHIINDYKNPVIVVCANALFCYPNDLKNKVVENGGVLISFAPESALAESNCNYRNMVVANVCDKVMVVSCAKRSSLLMTINQALCQGKAILVAPTSIEDEELANNSLISEGAICVYDKESFTNFVEED